LVDEVLAVGDTSFQQKCLDRMRAVLDEGATLVYVSHDLASVEASCARGVWLQDGVLRQDGPIAESLGAYRRSIEEAAEVLPSVAGLVNVRKVSISGPGGARPSTQRSLEISLILESQSARPGSLCLGVSEGPATPIFVVRRDIHLVEGEVEVRCAISVLPLPRGRFYLWLAIQGWGDPMPWHPAAHFDVDGPDLDIPPHAVARMSPVHVNASWELDSR
jgi:hypothetical protein